MSQVFVVCPNCGATVPTDISVESVRVDTSALLVSFKQRFASHTCEVAP